MKLGFIGLGRMGGNMVDRLVKDGHEVLISGRNPEHVAEAAAKTGATVGGTYQEMVEKLGADPIVWIMVPSDVVDDQLDKLLEIMPKGGVIVDGGNSDYRETRRRAQKVAAAGLTMVDAGTSGGILAVKAGGYCIMVGGDDAVVERLNPVFESLAQNKGWGHFGPAGAGHFTKMVHNAIEYGMMQSLAEGYNLLKTSGDYPELDLGKLGQVWQHGSVIESLLNRLCAESLEANPNLDGIDGYVAESGEARWTLERAKEVNVSMPSIQASFDVRLASQQGETNFGTQLLAAMRHAFGGHAIGKPKS